MKRTFSPITRSTTKRARLEADEAETSLSGESAESEDFQLMQSQIGSWLQQTYQVPQWEIEHLYKRLYIGVFLRLHPHAPSHRQAMILVTSPEIAHTDLNQLVDHSIQYYPVGPDEKGYSPQWHVERRLPLAGCSEELRDHIPLLLFSLGRIPEMIQEQSVWETLTSRLSKSPQTERSFEMDWVWVAVKIFMEDGLNEPLPEALTELPQSRPGYHDELQLWGPANQPLSDTTGGWVARKLGPTRFKWGAH